MLSEVSDPFMISNNAETEWKRPRFAHAQPNAPEAQAWSTAIKPDRNRETRAFAEHSKRPMIKSGAFKHSFANPQTTTKKNACDRFAEIVNNVL